MYEHAFQSLTPTTFLERSAQVYGDRLAIVDGSERFTYSEFLDRSLCLSGALRDLGIAVGDRVAVLSANTHIMLEAHNGVPLAGAVLVSMNVRLQAHELAFILKHSESRVLIHDAEFGELAADIIALSGIAPTVIDAGTDYEAMLRASDHHRIPVTDEHGLLAINYTSGTTGSPKGVMYHHRGAYLQSLAMASHSRMTPDSTYLWTLPMFHCNGWCFTWAVTVAGATHVCLSKPEPGAVWEAIHAEGITHFCAAPTVLTSLTQHREAAPAKESIWVAAGGAPPTPTLLERCADLGLNVTHLYGLTETFGPAVISDWRSEWDELPTAEQARRRARQGVGNVISSVVRVIDDSGQDVTADGISLGEVAFRGNNVMLGYYKDPEETAAAIPDGWFRTGDLAVVHSDGYLEIRDRRKDVIISGGENISSVEVEKALASHPAVLEAAVVAVPSEKWGERPVAFVSLRDGHNIEPDKLRQHVRSLLASFKVPDRIEFGQLPKTSTGKIQKFRLRESARAATEPPRRP